MKPHFLCLSNMLEIKQVKTLYLERLNLIKVVELMINQCYQTKCTQESKLLDEYVNKIQ